MAKKSKQAKKKTAPKKPAKGGKKRPKAPARRKRGTYGGNSVSLTYDTPTSTFIATISVAPATANIHWWINSVTLYDPDGSFVAPMDQDSADPDTWTYWYQDPVPGKWDARGDFGGDDEEDGYYTVPTSGAKRAKRR